MLKISKKKINILVFTLALLFMNSLLLAMKDKNRLVKCFYNAILEGNLKKVKKLILKGVDVNKYQYGETCLSAACRYNKIEIVRVLLKQPKIDVNKGESCFPLYNACEQLNVEIIKELLKHPKIDVNKCNERRRLPFFCLIQANIVGINSYRNEKIIKKFLKHPKFNVNATGAHIWRCITTLLHGACFFHCYNIVKLLLQNGAKIDKNTKKLMVSKMKKSFGGVKNCLFLTEAYNNKSNSEKLELICNTRKKNKEAFEFLMRLAFGQSLLLTKGMGFFKILYEYVYKNYKKDLKKIFFVTAQEDIYNFIKKVVKNENNCFKICQNELEKIIFSLKLYQKIKKKNYIDVNVKFL